MTLKRSRIKPKPRRNRDTDESLAIREQYRLDNPECELSQLLKRLGHIHWIDSNKPETHHVVGGSGRLDLVSNLIMLSPTLHRIVEAEPTYGRLCCLIVKAAKKPPEINAAEFRQCSGYHLSGWLSLDKTIAACPPWLEAYRLNLLSSFKGGER